MAVGGKRQENTLMLATKDFIGSMHVLAASDHPEAALKAGVDKVFARYIIEICRIFPKQKDGRAQIRASVTELQSDLERETGLFRPGVLGMLIGHAHELTSRWLASN
jgi:hypothetical protein